MAGLSVVSDAYLPSGRPSGRQRFNVLGALHAITHEIVTVTNDPDIDGGGGTPPCHPPSGYRPIRPTSTSSNG